MWSYYYVVTRYDVIDYIVYVYNIVNHFDLIELFINKV